MPKQPNEFDAVYPPTNVKVDDREREILTRIAAGQQDQVIAEAMKLSVRTVKWAVSQLNERMGTKNRPHLVAWALRRKLIP